MSHPAAAAPTPRRRRWRRWLWRGFFAVLAVLVVLLAVHRPLGHWAIRHFGARFAEKAGFQAAWKSSGSLVRDLAFDEVRVTGGDNSVVRSLSVEHAAVEYDLRRLRSTGVGGVVDKVVLRRVDAEIDLTRGAAKPKPERQPPAPGTPRLPSVRVPILEIEHLSMRVRRPNGVIEVVDFSLTLDPARPGTISVARFSAPGVPELRGAAGTTRATEDSVTLENVALWPEVSLERLAVQLADLSSGRLGVDAVARQGTSSVAVQGEVGLGSGDGPVVEAKAILQSVTNNTLAFWGVPDGGLGWNGGAVTLQANGPVLWPDQLAAELSVSDATLMRTGLPEVTIAAAATLKDGVFTLAESRLAAGRTTATVRGTAAAPATWAGVAAATAQATADFEIPALEEALPKEAGVRGRATGRAEVAVAERALTAATATVDGSEIVVQGLPIERVTTRVTTADGGRLQVKAQTTLNAANTLDAEGWMDTRGEQKFEATWKADCRDLATVPVEARAGLPWPTAGTVVSSGSMAGSVPAVRSRDWPQLTGSGEVQARGLKVREAVMESMRVRAQVAEGAARVEELAVRFDAENTVTGSGRVALVGEAAAFSGQVRAVLPSMARVSAWSTAFGGPGVRGGSATIDWEGRGEAGVVSSQGTGSVVVRGLQIQGVPEVLGLEAAVSHSGESISLPRLSASAGPWRAEGRAVWNGTTLEVPALTASLNTQRVVRASGTLPIGRPRGEGVTGPIDPEAPLSVSLQVEALDLDRLGTSLGRPLPVRGVLQAGADFSGPLGRLTGRATAEVRQLRPAGPTPRNLEPASVSLTAALSGGRLTLNGRAQQRPLQPFTLEAQAPVDAAALVRNPAGAREIPLTGRLRLAQSSLAFLPGWVPAVGSVRGTATFEATIAGTVGRPRWQATGSVNVPEARMAGAALPSIRDAVVRIRSDEKRIIIEQASVMLAGGRLNVQGGADLTQWQDPVLDLRLAAEEVLVIRDENLSLRANAGVTCRGPVSRAAVAGSIDLVRGRVFKEIEFLPLSLPNQLPPPPPPTTLARSGPPSFPPPFDAWTVDVAIRTRDPIRLMGNVARGNVVADLRLAGTGARPVLTGRATLEQMWLRLPFSRLTITEGSIVFTEDRPFDPQINVVGESITDGRVVEVAVQGRALAPTVRFTSSPPLPEGEIATLLATGVTTSDLTNRGDEAAGRAAFVLLQQTYRRMFRQSPLIRDDAEPPRLSFQFSFFGSDPSRRNVSAIYEINPRWRVIGRVGEAGTFRGMLHYMIRFR